MMNQNGARAKLFIMGSFVTACTTRVARLPMAGESLAASGFRLEPGGKGFNQAVAARRLGAEVDGLFAVGDDALGALATPAFAHADLDPAMLRRRPGATGAGVGFIAEDGETAIAVFSGANASLSAQDAEDARPALEAAAVTLAQFEIGDAAIAEAFAIARGADRITVLNPSPFRPVAPEILATCSIVVANAVETEALALALGVAVDLDAESVAAALFARGVNALVATRGAAGAIARLADGAILTQPAFEVETVDTIGAGDAFAAGFATTFAETGDWPKSLRHAAACGALAVRAEGGFGAFPTRAERDALLAAVW